MLETYLEFWQNKKGILGHFYFSKNSKVILISIWILKSDFRFFYKMIALVIYNSIIFCCY